MTKPTDVDHPRPETRNVDDGAEDKPKLNENGHCTDEGLARPADAKGNEEDGQNIPPKIAKATPMAKDEQNGQFTPPRGPVAIPAEPTNDQNGAAVVPCGLNEKKYASIKSMVHGLFSLTLFAADCNMMWNLQRLPQDDHVLLVIEAFLVIAMILLVCAVMFLIWLGRFEVNINRGTVVQRDVDRAHGHNKIFSAISFIIVILNIVVYTWYESNAGK